MDDDHFARPQPERVVGLRYDGPDALPRVVLKGAGPLAQELMQQRRRLADAPAVVHNPGLVDALYRLPVDAPIGADLFHAVAAILAHVLAVDGQQRGVTHDG